MASDADHADAQIGTDADTDAEAQEYRSLVASATKTLDRVDRALAQLAEGSYGRCGACGAPIGDEVLARDPTAQRCAEHAAEGS